MSRQDDWPIIGDLGRIICKASTGRCTCERSDVPDDCCETLRNQARRMFWMLNITSEEAALLATGEATVRRKPRKRAKTAKQE